MYQALYRKWRPQTFADVSGQPHITKTLASEVETGRLSHAYLFIGSRGTGKTTCAKVLAKAVNCLHPQNGNPCNECEICRGIESGSILDVVEMDAASNNGVDKIRELLDEVHFTPVQAKYRVYIIDEVHMLSIGAFNALLKTLEEPPSHVKFILATTEVHKLPQTILSRCQRFDFKRIAPEEIADRLRYVAGEEQVTLTEDAAMLLARMADGAMRDALSLLDQCISRTGDITIEIVHAVGGLAGKSYLQDAAYAIRKQDCPALLNLVGALHTESIDMERFCAELLQYYRNLMVAKTVLKPQDLMICTDEECRQMQDVASKYTLQSIIYVIEQLQETLVSLKSGAEHRLAMELALIRISTPELDTSNDALLRRISMLERKLEQGIAVTEAPVKEKTVTPVKETPKPVEAPDLPVTSDFDEFVPPEEPEQVLPEPAVRPEVKAESKPQPKPQSEPQAGDLPQWPEVLQEISRTNQLLSSLLRDSRAGIAGQTVEIDALNAMLPQVLEQAQNADTILAAVYQVTGQQCSLVKCKAQQKQSKKDPLADLRNRAAEAGIPFYED